MRKAVSRQQEIAMAEYFGLACWVDREFAVIHTMSELPGTYRETHLRCSSHMLGYTCGYRSRLRTLRLCHG